MEDSSSTTQEKTQETLSPCYFIEALSAILKCLGLQIIMTNQHNSSSNSDEKVNEATPQNTDAATTDPENTDLQARPTSEGNLAVNLAVPQRPGIEQGRGGQIN